MVVLFIGCCGCYTDTETSAGEARHENGEKQKLITQNMALQAAVEFIGFTKEHLGLSPAQISQLLGSPIQDFNPNVGMTWEYNSKLGTVAVSQSTGEIVTYFDSDDLDGIETKISMDEAVKELRRFVAVVYTYFNESRFVLVKKENKNGNYEFEFEQKAITGEYSIFHNFLALSVRSDIPRVVMLDRSALNFIRTTPPTIDKNKALRLFQERINEGGNITEIHLFEKPSNGTTEAITVWAASVEYKIDGLESLEMIFVNADTGISVEFKE